jgi:hypothetical protein
VLQEISFGVGQRLSYPIAYSWGMSKNPIFSNWQMPRRQPFGARRGIGLLRAWRLRVVEQCREPYTQTEFVFVHREGGRQIYRILEPVTTTTNLESSNNQ